MQDRYLAHAGGTPALRIAISIWEKLLAGPL